MLQVNEVKMLSACPWSASVGWSVNPFFFLTPWNLESCHPTRLSSTLHVYLSNSPPMQIFIGAQQLKELLSYKKVKGSSQAANAENCIQCGPWSDTSGHWIVGQSLFSSGTYIVFLHKASSQLQAHCS